MYIVLALQVFFSTTYLSHNYYTLHSLPSCYYLIQPQSFCNARLAISCQCYALISRITFLSFRYHISAYYYILLLPYMLYYYQRMFKLLLPSFALINDPIWNEKPRIVSNSIVEDTVLSSTQYYTISINYRLIPIIH